MSDIQDESYDIIIVFDVLEHVPDYKKALEAVDRVLTKNGFGIFTVPQQDHLFKTYEDEKIVSSEGRTEHFG